MSLVQPQPPRFQDHRFNLEFEINESKEKIWTWLNKPETFTDTQIPPYKVEFYSPDPENIPNGMNEGVLNIHHGPFINFAGVMGKIEPNQYRDLQYFHGSYAFSLRWIRPYRLEFWIEEGKNKTSKVRMQLSTWVRPWISGIWTSFQKLFWSRFEGWMKRSLR